MISTNLKKPLYTSSNVYSPKDQDILDFLLQLQIYGLVNKTA